MSSGDALPKSAEQGEGGRRNDKAEQEPCGLEVQAVAAPGRFLERHHIIATSKGGDLAYRSIRMDLISCFSGTVGSEHSAENNGALQVAWVFRGKM